MATTREVLTQLQVIGNLAAPQIQLGVAVPACLSYLAQLERWLANQEPEIDDGHNSGAEVIALVLDRVQRAHAAMENIYFHLQGADQARQELEVACRYHEAYANRVKFNGAVGPSLDTLYMQALDKIKNERVAWEASAQESVKTMAFGVVHLFHKNQRKLKDPRPTPSNLADVI